MREYGLSDFLSDTEDAVGRGAEPADCVEAVVPLLHRLISGSREFLTAAHLRSDPEHYARIANHVGEASGLSLYALVWMPGSRDYWRSET